MTRALTILGLDAVAALEAAGLTVEDLSYVVDLENAAAEFCCTNVEGPGDVPCSPADFYQPCIPCRARWRIAERGKEEP